MGSTNDKFVVVNEGLREGDEVVLNASAYRERVKLATKLGLDGIFVPINGYCGFEEEVHAEGENYLDEWGITYVKSGWPVMVQIDVPIKSRADWNNYSMPDPRAPTAQR